MTEGTNNAIYRALACPSPPGGSARQPIPSRRPLPTGGPAPGAQDAGPPRRDASTATPPPASLASPALGGWFHHGVNAGERSLQHLGGRGSSREDASVLSGAASGTLGHPDGLGSGPGGRSFPSFRTLGRGERWREGRGRGAPRSVEADTSRLGSWVIKKAKTRKGRSLALARRQ